MLFLPLMSCHAAPPPLTIVIKGVGSATPVHASWQTKTDHDQLSNAIKTLIEWQERGMLIAYRVKVFPNHPLVKKVLSAPSVLIVPTKPSSPHLRASINTGGAILVEYPTGSMMLFEQPEGQSIDWSKLVVANAQFSGN